MLLNNGIAPNSGEAIIPPSALSMATWAHSIMVGQAVNAHTSLVGYGMGWYRYTYRGHEVRTTSSFTLCNW